MIVREHFEVTTQDCVTLKGILLIPPQPKAVVQFNGGTAAKKEFYLPFLEFLAERSYICCLWDYRGSGESAPASLKGCGYYFHEYGTLDMPAIKQFLQHRYPTLPLLLVGHSAGGQQVGLMPSLDGYQGMVGFAVSTGYLPYMPLGYRLLSWYFFNLFTPASIATIGYLGAKRFGIMEDLPKNVVREWRAWCRKADYLFDSKFYGNTIPQGHYANMPFPIHVFWSTDDPISNHRSIPAFWRHVKSRFGIQFSKLSPNEYAVKEIGHFGFFKKKMATTLWEKTANVLSEFVD